MNGRLVLAALAAVSLASCKSAGGPRTYLVEKDHHFAIAVQSAKTIQIFPLPADARVVTDGTWARVGPGGGGEPIVPGIIPVCPCTIQKCAPFCHPFPGTGFDPPADVTLEPGQAPVIPDRNPATP